MKKSKCKNLGVFAETLELITKIKVKKFEKVKAGVVQFLMSIICLYLCIFMYELQHKKVGLILNAFAMANSFLLWWTGKDAERRKEAITEEGRSIDKKKKKSPHSWTICLKSLLVAT